MLLLLLLLLLLVLVLVLVLVVLAVGSYTVDIILDYAWDCLGYEMSSRVYLNKYISVCV